MIAKIGHGSNIVGVLTYNQLKVDKQIGAVLTTHRIVESPNGHYAMKHLLYSFEPYLIANKRTEKPVLHISLNPDPSDNVTDEGFVRMAQDYMQQMGYGEQPYIVFKHSDIERTHIHIVSVCVDRYGKKISDSYEKRRSMDVCRMLEEKYNLTPATQRKKEKSRPVFHLVDYKRGDVKSQIASVVRYLPKYYYFQSFGAYNALLPFFNISAEEVKGELRGQPKNGLVYFALNEQGEKASNPFKASLFGKYAGLGELEKHYEKSKAQMRNHPSKDLLKTAIESVLYASESEMDFRKQLIDQGVNAVIRRNREGRIYGITFVDHENRMVWNGSQLGKALSANVFNDYWNNNFKSKNIEMAEPQLEVLQIVKTETEPVETSNHLFDFLYNESVLEKYDDTWIEGLGSLLPQALGEDYEEHEFTRRMKRKKRKKR
ncbi:conjugal transfer protein MobB [Flavobacterium sp.]|uniref:conjugal transfer protein MobB n=1 Tax=Flavobacterium sp. TaxID=239 RepID=UPI003A8E45EF